MSLTVVLPAQYSTEEALTKSTLTITAKKDAKNCNGTIFMNIRMSIPTLTPNIDCWFRIENIPLSRGVADPADGEGDPRNKFVSSRNKVETSIARAGAFGKLMVAFNNQYKAQIAEFKNQKIIPPSKPVTSLINEFYSDQHRDIAMRGTPKPDPGLRFGLNFGKFSDTMYPKVLRGTPTLTIYNADTERVVDGKTVYDIATVKYDDGKIEQINEKNMHMFINDGSVIVSGRVYIDSVAVASGQVSCPIKAHTLVIRRGAAAGFSDEAVAPVASSTVVPPTTDTTATPPATVDTPTTPATPTDNTPNVVEPTVTDNTPAEPTEILTPEATKDVIEELMNF